MNALVANFWWERKEEGKSIHWKSWWKMTMAESMGRLGSKDLAVFNNALLANQCQRLKMKPDALWARVMKGIYFHDKDISEAGKGGRA